MFLCASFVLAGVSLEYSSLYGAHTILRGNGGFLDVCASVKDALDLAQNDSSGIVASVDVKCAPEGCMRIAFSANGKDGALWIGHGLKLTSNNVKRTSVPCPKK